MKTKCVDWNTANDIIDHRKMTRCSDKYLLRQCIAEMLGWSKIIEGDILTGEHPDTKCIVIPHFDRDCDGCKKAERYLFDKDKFLFGEYIVHLANIVNKDYSMNQYDKMIALHIATPKERCKAIILTTSGHVKKCRSCKSRIMAL